MSIKTWTSTNDEGDEEDVSIPCHWEICPTCSGDGKHSQHLGAYSMEDFNEQFSPEEQEQYMNGGYDKTCEDCNGAGKVQQVDEKQFQQQNPEMYERWVKWQEEEALDRSVSEMERRMGA